MSTKSTRIYSIDMFKGICMLYMIVDHWRDHLSRMAQEVLGAANTLPIHAGALDHVHSLSFWLRCTGGYIFAPTFLFLAGVSCALWHLRRGPEASLFSYLVHRGFMLIILNCLLFFHAPFSQGGSITLHVLWPLGIGMILLGIMGKAPKSLLWALSIFCLVGQNFFENLQFSSPFLETLWTLAFKEASIALPWGASVYNLWPFMPWSSMLLLGYLCAPIFLRGKEGVALWTKLGLVCLVTFLALRLSGIYGDPHIWQIYDSTFKTFGALITLSKYPPSLQFTLYGLGFTFLILALLIRSGYTNNMLLLFGNTPLFFYVAHLICLRAVKFLLMRLPDPLMHSIQNMLFSSWGIFVGTTFLSGILYVLCSKYKTLRTQHIQKNKNTVAVAQHS